MREQAVDGMRRGVDRERQANTPVQRDQLTRVVRRVKVGIQVEDVE
jgi:hypothetical protein